ncbi:preprotein translocase subunit SecG [Candidatus Gottesmanbacteria bacterium RIFCSPLOWO2_02_FULL_42_29]|uniref:Protein-export membrane protein SecG n=2 Tax=Candidatus Gottesmaniibacteriota TaxID=1752720 RepID=A0A1F6B934_9BACT|nr:MAG: Preprotein translocase, SecG subunit [Candidatus Gottesmanbacteria bacterium GW2011_GWA2_42_18]OGG10065.1 MAG: preprotein translocase subunit SecG [Candidatus Gottesmanbacteria bacterium RIFCSPHIGHO2_01_FULL_42_27]OGG20324.1 MAG: preprotein translocase subunit SecG [Candidatus Gottesmanbacteria bacterium RIFCSPHIGHO2_12_FULL_43_26]OGG33295.1 MAG: preprotein translocase subunit SecG [Candidatus Gottesmanbacteria bacterium RIFCSPLOWO2_12_FULL_42_10]OGG33461.1 MAG: preprotein translocase s
MQQTLVIIQIIVSVSLIAVILIQAKGVGLGRAWGGGGEFYKSRRGVEKVIFRLTVVLVALFLASSILGVIYL